LQIGQRPHALIDDPQLAGVELPQLRHAGQALHAIIGNLSHGKIERPQVGESLQSRTLQSGSAEDQLFERRSQAAHFFEPHIEDRHAFEERVAHFELFERGESVEVFQSLAVRCPRFRPRIPHGPGQVQLAQRRQLPERLHMRRMHVGRNHVEHHDAEIGGWKVGHIRNAPGIPFQSHPTAHPQRPESYLAIGVSGVQAGRGNTKKRQSA